MRGHGGPVRALAILSAGAAAVSGSFDHSAILWDLRRGEARAVLRLHEGAVNAVAALGEDRFATGGEDGRIAIWRVGATEPETVGLAHSGPIAGLALSRTGEVLASASWDGTIRAAPLAGGDVRILSGHAGPVSAVAWLPEGRLASAGFDGTVRFWPADGSIAEIQTLGSPVNALAATAEGEVAAGGADGIVRFLAPGGAVRAELDVSAGPILALAASPDGAAMAVATIGRAVAILDRAGATVRTRLAVPGGPVWALAFAPDGSDLLTGGSDGAVRRWNARTGEPAASLSPEPPPARSASATSAVPPGTERGADVFRACAACHTLTRDGGNRAGPSLHGVFGRRIATAPGYAFSPALRALDIVWTADTIDQLFAVGPARYTPGTKMPEQVVPAADRRELVRFLEAATRSSP